MVFRIFILASVLLVSSAVYCGKPGVSDSIRYYAKEADRLVSNEPKKAEMYARRILELIKKQPDPVSEANAYKILGVGPYYAGNFTVALGFYLEGLKKSENQKHAGASAILLNEIGTLYKKQGDLEKSEQTFLQALKFSREQPDSLQIANSLNNLGIVHEMKENFPEALRLYRESAEMKEKLGDEVGLAYNLANIGSVLALMKRFDEAVESILKSSEIRKRVNDIKGLAINNTLLGETHAQKGDQAAALRYFFASLVGARETKYIDLENFIYNEVSKIYEQQGDYKQAHTYHKMHVALKDSLFNAQRAEQLLEMEQKYKAEKRDKEVAEHKTALAESQLLIKRRNNIIIIVSSVAIVILALGIMLFVQQRARQRQLKKESDLRQKLAEAELINKVQGEKARISRDLHDHIGSQLTLITTSLDNLGQRLNGDGHLAPQVEMISGHARDTMAQLRETIWAMNKESISADMLLAKISEFAQRSSQAMGENRQITTAFSGQGKLLISPSKSLAIFRVCQEAVNNAIKHAAFTEMRLSLDADEGKIRMNISDNGRGFDKEEAISRGYGLENMAYRIQEAGGEFTLESAPGKGTHITMQMGV